MKQVFQMLGTGDTLVSDVPVPELRPGHLLIRTKSTLVSAGTEKMLVDFGKSNLIQKARSQPDKVRAVLDKARTDGILTTIEAVKTKLDQPLPLGYSNVGIVDQVGSGVAGFNVGDRVVSNGHHAGVVRVAQNLCARVPDDVSDESAAFAVVASIALHGVRLSQPMLGERVVVIGLGLIGLITVQLLRANGCKVLALDFAKDRLKLAESFGAQTVDLGSDVDPVAVGMSFSNGVGLDAALITAATDSNDPVRQSAQMCRKRGRIILVGVAGLELSRADFYEKELSFQVSCSYGPGRYDPNYEDKGQDYPIAYVRWTEQRNFEAALDLMSSGAIDLQPLISHRFSILDALDAYSLLSSGKNTLGILLDFPEETSDTSEKVVTLNAKPVSPAGSATVSVIGSGNYSSRVLIPAFKEAGAVFQTLINSGGASAVHVGRKNGFQHIGTDPETAFRDSVTSSVVIATRHDTHAEFVRKALQAGKNVFVEKPMCLSHNELAEIEASLASSDSAIMAVGFNRRFSPLSKKMKELLGGLTAPKSLVLTVNAGAIPDSHWTQDLTIGGGRIVGEGCHFIDLARFFVSSPICTFTVSSIRNNVSRSIDTVTITLDFEDGSIATVHYFANGHASFPKERIEAFCSGRVLQLDNFRVLHGFGWNGFRKQRLFRQDKGQSACVAAFMQAVRSGGPPPIPHDEILEVSRVSIDVQEALS